MINADQVVKQCFDLAMAMYPANTSSVEQRNAYQITLLESKLREVVAMHNRTQAEVIAAGGNVDRAHMRDMPSPAADGPRNGGAPLAPRLKTTSYFERDLAGEAAKAAEFEDAFAEAWATMEAKGYRYGADALDNVRVGFNLGVEWVFAKA